MATKGGHSIHHAQYPIRVKGNSRCPDHKENDVILLCQKCNVLICVSCSITSHKPHIDSFIEISKIKSQHQGTLQDFVNETDQIRIPRLSEQIRSAREELSTCDSKYKDMSNSIIKQREECRLQLDKITEDYLSMCENMERSETNLIQVHIVNLEDRLDTLVKLSTDCKQTLQSGDAVLVIDTVSGIQDRDFDVPQTADTNMAEFTPCKYIQSHLKQAMGELKAPEHVKAELESGGQSNKGPAGIPKQSVSNEMQGTIPFKLLNSPMVVSKFSYPFKITSICPRSDGFAWIFDWETNIVKLVNNRGQFIQKLDHDKTIHQISLDPTTGRLWFCCSDEKTIHEVSSAHTPVTRFTTEGWPVSLCVTKEGRIVVGISDEKGYKVIMYSADGRVLHTATEEASCLGVVWSTTQCPVTGNIAVVSTKQVSRDNTDSNSNKPHLVVYNPTLQSLFQYRAGIKEQEEVVSLEHFEPGTVVYDSHGNMALTDMSRNTIELISGTGEYIKTLYTNKGELGIIGMQRGDVLWPHLKAKKWGVKLFKYYCE